MNTSHDSQATYQQGQTTADKLLNHWSQQAIIYLYNSKRTNLHQVSNKQKKSVIPKNLLICWDFLCLYKAPFSKPATNTFIHKHGI